jgi:general secretion pathway protein G
MTARTRKTQGFTLVEILIVVVILGILAAIVIPQFTSASETAKGSSLVSQLQTLRSQIELYQIQHNGDYPETWAELTSRTNADGDVMSSGDETGLFPYGPYLQQPSRNPFITSAVGDDIDGTHWEYDSDTGRIRAFITPNQAVRAGLITDPSDLTSTHPDFVAVAD